MMKCPNCDQELIWGNEPSLKTGKMASFMYCENCGFLTESADPSRVLAEVESAYKWNEVKDE